MTVLNFKEIKDKIYGCWLGKNIGGTIGTPYEGKTEMQDISGFASKKGEPLPNDDLDLQLVWLRALEEVGPWSLNSEVLGEYWLSMITPSWNEYGLSKANMRRGFVPPISGEIGNRMWKNSNGAWIRSEIWACLAPGYPGIARRYAFEDASVDHGMSEGTVAELFTATLESEAFVCNDVMNIISRGLEAIPENSRVAKAVKLAVECYEKGIDYRQARNMLVDQSADIGFFQAPANLGYVTLGLLYGGGDFKKSIIYAVNCGDDTDCTGATVGAVLGIIYGASGIPEDWKEYIGDRIMTICVGGNFVCLLPKTCSELTERVMKMMPAVFLANGVDISFGNSESHWDENRLKKGVDGKKIMSLAPCSVRFSDVFFSGTAEYEKEPVLTDGESMKIHVTLKANHEPVWVSVDMRLPDGFCAVYPENVLINPEYTLFPGRLCEFDIVMTAENIRKSSNTAIMILKGEGRMKNVCVPFVIGSK